MPLVELDLDLFFETAVDQDRRHALDPLEETLDLKLGNQTHPHQIIDLRKSRCA